MRPRRSPFGKGANHNLDNGPLALGLAAGFAASGIGVFGAMYMLGRWIRPGGTAGPLLLFAVALACLAVADLADARVSLVRRQTPERLLSTMAPSVVGFAWGLDTGLVFTTFRTSAASWAALLCTLVGILPWWVGIAYAAAFIVPTIALSAFNHSHLAYQRIATSPRLARLASLDLADLEERVFVLRRPIRTTSGILMLALAGVTLVLVVARQHVVPKEPLQPVGWGLAVEG